MSIIITEVYEAFLSAGAPEAKAKAAAAAIPIAKDLATKQDLAEFKAATQQDLANVKAELKSDIAELKSDITVLKFAVFTFSPVILGLLIKLVFFP